MSSQIPEVVREDGVERHVRGVDERRIGHRRGCTQGRVAGEEAGDRRAMGTRGIRVDLEALSHRLGNSRRVVVDHEGAADEGHDARPGVRHVVPAVGQRSVVTRSYHQVAAPFAPVRAGEADVGHPAEPHVVDRAEDARRSADRRDVDDHRSVGEVDERPEVDGVAVRRQEDRRRTHELGEEGERAVLDADREEAAADRGDGRPPQRAQERLHALAEVQVVVQEGGGGVRRGAVVELQGAEPALDPVGRRDRLQLVRGQALLGTAHHARSSWLSGETSLTRQDLSKKDWRGL